MNLRGQIKLMLISRSAVLASRASSLGIDRVMVDLESLGKVARQFGRDTHLSSHTIEDVARVGAVMDPEAELVVRIDPVGEHTVAQLEQVLEHEPDLVMLPMFRSADEVERFVSLVGDRARTLLLVETKEAVDSFEEIIAVGGFDEVHVGLNDLHISSQKRFMFEHLTDGSVERVVALAQAALIPCGVGGIARLGEGLLRSELVLAEHVRLGSAGVILSRTFTRDIAEDAPTSQDLQVIREEVGRLRDYEAQLRTRTADAERADRGELARAIEDIVAELAVEDPA